MLVIGKHPLGSLLHVAAVLGKNGTYFLLLEYEENKDDSHLFMWYGESQL